MFISAGSGKRVYGMRKKANALSVTIFLNYLKIKSLTTIAFVVM
jgi:hypothetical protein